jgi:F-type H+-transporting ATPase subunit c
MSLDAGVLASTTITISHLGALGYGLAAIGPGIGIGLVFGHAIEAIASPRPAAASSSSCGSASR